MAKKKELDAVLEDLNLAPTAPKAGIQPIAHDFGRADLNELRDRLNEVIKKVN